MGKARKKTVTVQPLFFRAGNPTTRLRSCQGSVLLLASPLRIRERGALGQFSERLPTNADVPLMPVPAAVDALDDLRSEPTSLAVETLGRLDGDLLLLGAGAQM